MKITTAQLREIIREEIRKVRLTEASFLDGFKKANSGYDPKKALANWADEYEKQEDWDDVDVSGDKEDHEQYLKNGEKWIKKMSSKGPTVKVGDLVKVFMRSNGKEGIGKIVKAGIMKGNFGFMGNLEPDNVPAWVIDCYTERNIGTKKTIDYKGKTYYFIGTLQYPQHQEGEKESFSKL
jgi:YHS domain-containing protein